MLWDPSEAVNGAGLQCSLPPLPLPISAALLSTCHLNPIPHPGAVSLHPKKAGIFVHSTSDAMACQRPMTWRNWPHSPLSLCPDLFSFLAPSFSLQNPVSQPVSLASVRRSQPPCGECTAAIQRCSSQLTGLTSCPTLRAQPITLPP